MRSGTTSTATASASAPRAAARLTPRAAGNARARRSVGMDSWKPEELNKMKCGGNGALNAFLKQYGVPKDTDIPVKYNTRAAEVYRDKVKTEAGGGVWKAPPVVKENLSAGGGGQRRMPSSSSTGRMQSVSSNNSSNGPSNGWDDWGGGGGGGGGGMKRTGSASSFQSRNGGTGAQYTREQYEESARNKDAYFERIQRENQSKPEGVPPNQGGKYVGFGSNPVTPKKSGGHIGFDSKILDDGLNMLTEGMTRLSTATKQAVQYTGDAINSSARGGRSSSYQVDGGAGQGGYDQQGGGAQYAGGPSSLAAPSSTAAFEQQARNAAQQTLQVSREVGAKTMQYAQQIWGSAKVALDNFQKGGASSSEQMPLSNSNADQQYLRRGPSAGGYQDGSRMTVNTSSSSDWGGFDDVGGAGAPADAPRGGRAAASSTSRPTTPRGASPRVSSSPRGASSPRLSSSPRTSSTREIKTKDDWGSDDWGAGSKGGSKADDGWGGF